MSQPGIGAILHYLGGGSKHNASEFYGRTICGAEIIENRLRLTLDGPEQIEIWDDGQSCCESRYMTCDDDLSGLCGHKLTRIETKDGPDTEGEYGECHEQVFVEVGTDKGFVTIANHNEHNGYYGGFGLTITKVEPANADEIDWLDCFIDRCDREHCPRCGSPKPHLHPAVQVGGEVQPCNDPFHKRATPENRPNN